MLTAEKVRQAVAQFVATGNLDSFEDWIAQSTWNVARDSAAETRALVADVELRLSEYSNGHLPLEQMMAEFKDLANGLPVINVRRLHSSIPNFDPCTGTLATFQGPAEMVEVRLGIKLASARA